MDENAVFRPQHGRAGSGHGEDGFSIVAGCPEDAIDHQDGDGHSAGFEAHSELLVECSEN